MYFVDFGKSIITPPGTYPQKMATSFSGSSAFKTVTSWKFNENKKTRDQIFSNVVSIFQPELPLLNYILMMGHQFRNLSIN